MAQAEKLHEVGTGVLVKREGNTMTLVIDLSKRHGDSASGKTVKVASTNGILAVSGDEGIRYGFNAFIMKGKPAAA